MIAWLLTLNGITRTLAAWSIRTRELTYRSLDEDNFVFTIEGDITASCPVGYAQSVKLARQTDGATPVCVFLGTVTQVLADGDARTSAWTVTCSNVWYQLARTAFQQPIAAYNDACALVAGLKSTKVVLFSDPDTGVAITTGQQIQNVITYAVTLGIPVALGVAPAFVNAFLDTARDLMLADVIRRALALTPDAVSWVDYSSGVSVINFQQRASLTAVAIDVTADPAVIQAFSLRRRDDMVPSGVRFNYIGMGAACPPKIAPGCPDPATGTTNGTDAPVAGTATSQLTKLTQDDAGLPDQPGGLIATIDLTLLTAATTEPAPIGLALQYYVSLVTPIWEGAVTTREPECTLLARPGNVLNLAHGHADWAGMNAVVQQVEANLLTGETRIVCGPPSHLAPQDFVTLIMQMRRRPWLQNAFASTRPPGTADAPNCDAGKQPDAQAALDRARGDAAATAAAINNGASGSQNNLGRNLATNAVDVCSDGSVTTLQLYGPPR